MTKEDSKKRAEWVKESHSLSVRAKALEHDCIQYKIRFSEECNKRTRSRSDDPISYQEELWILIRSLKKNCEDALRVLSIANSQNEVSNQIDVQKEKCLKHTTVYEKVLQTITDRLHKDSITNEKDLIFHEKILRSNQAKIELWETKDIAEKSAKTYAASAQKKAQMRKEENAKPCDVIAEINAEIMKDKGPYGNFHPDEHRAFMKVWEKINGEYVKIVESVRKYSPEQLQFRTSEELEEHSEWYLRHMERMQRRHQCIESWKQGKIRDETNQQKERRKVNELQIKRKCVQDGKKELELQEKKKAMVTAWRREKEEKEREEREVCQRVLSENTELNKLKQKTKCEKLRKQVNKFKTIKEKENIENPASSPASIVQSPGLNQSQIEKRREKDMEYAKKKRALVMKKKNRLDQRGKRIKALGDSVQLGQKILRDPKRLNKETKNSIKRVFSACELVQKDFIKKSSSAHSRPITMGGRDLMSPGARKATPSWRQGL